MQKSKRKLIVSDPLNEGKYMAVYVCPENNCGELLVSEDTINKARVENKDDLTIAVKCQKCSELIEF